MISVRNLRKIYVDDDVETRALDGVSFDITPGEFVAIMGPSGSGKSTLLHIMSFLDRPTSGEYSFFGKHIDALTDSELAETRNRGMGFVFQSFNLLPHASVGENVALPLLYNSLDYRERDSRVREAVASVGLEEKITIAAHKLSGGQKQRVAIARALVCSPHVIFADEPTGNLDSASGAQVMGILADLNRAGKTVILVTHETYTAEFARRIIRLRDGAVESDTETVHVRLRREEFVK
jgi:putative ABC transport system ATP-binding protein